MKKYCMLLLMLHFLVSCSDKDNIIDNGGDSDQEEELVKESFTFTIEESSITFEYPQGSITGLIKENRGYNGNNIFNFKEYTYNGVTTMTNDDVAPMHIRNATLGANHGQPIEYGTVTNHGLTNEDVGSEWLNDNGTKFYIMRIQTANTIAFLSENTGSKEDPSFAKLIIGNMTNGNRNLSITKIQNAQLYPSHKNTSIKVLKNGVEEIDNDGKHTANYVDVVEKYDIMNPDDILNNIKVQVGSSDDPVYNGESIITVKNTYRFLPRAVTLIISEYTINQKTKFRDLMFSQAIQTNKSAYYIPNSKADINGFNFTKPQLVNWSKDIKSIYCNSTTIMNESNPINRVLQYSESFGFAIGYLFDTSIGNTLNQTYNTFEIRGNTGKIYPHIYDSNKLGNYLNQGEKYSSVMYRVLMDTPKMSDKEKMSMYHFEYNNAEYVYIDYKGSINLDIVDLGAQFNKKKISIIEKHNTNLIEDIYNDGLKIQADYIENESCYIVLKIH